MTQHHPISTEIHNLLIQDKITSSQGKITFDFLNISIKINEKSAIGDLFQEWLAEWMRKKGIQFRTDTNSQKFPDFLLDQNSDITGLLEVKTFNYNASANFDIANFKAYCRSLKTQAYRLDADYLIFAYELEDSKFKIKNIWLKKIWEITGGSEIYPVKCQIKQEEIVNIRPISWYSTRATYTPFESRLDFVKALHDTLMQYPNTQYDSDDWFKDVQYDYLHCTGVQL